MSKALDLANAQDSGTILTPTITGDTLFSDGAYDFDVASHDGTNGLKLGGSIVSATAAELNAAIALADATTEANNAATAMAIALG